MQRLAAVLFLATASCGGPPSGPAAQEDAKTPASDTKAAPDDAPEAKPDNETPARDALARSAAAVGAGAGTVTAYYQSGQLRSGEASGSFEIWWKDGEFLMEQRWGDQVLRTGRDGPMVWEQDASGNVRVVSGLGSGQLAWGLEISPVARWERFFDRARTADGNDGTVGLILSGGLGGEASLELGAADSLPRQVSYIAEQGGSKVQTTLQYFDYAPVADIMVPGRIVADIGETKVVQEVEATKIGIEVDATRFARPAPTDDGGGNPSVTAAAGPESVAAPANLPQLPQRTGPPREVGGPPAFTGG